RSGVQAARADRGRQLSRAPSYVASAESTGGCRGAVILVAQSVPVAGAFRPGRGADLGGDAGARTCVRRSRGAGWRSRPARAAGTSPSSPGPILGAGERSVPISLDEPRALFRADHVCAWDAVADLDADGTDRDVALGRRASRSGSTSRGPPRDRSAGGPQRHHKYGGDPVNLGRLEPLRTLHLWLPGYSASRLRDRGRSTITRVWLTIADHFEPWWRGADDRAALARVEQWTRRWPLIAGRHADQAGRPPCYTFFYPEEQYHPAAIDALAHLTAMNIADVEVHLHHSADTETAFVDRLGRYSERLHARHGLLRRDDGRIRFGFIHGNWALDNSLPGGRDCGLDNEITLLHRLGCYADFTLPSAPSPAQTRIVNTI